MFLNAANAYFRKNFAFKCHRVKNNVYAINDIAFNPLLTFATVGSDGTFNFWDKDSKQRLKASKQCNLPITCVHILLRRNLVKPIGVGVANGTQKAQSLRTQFATIGVRYV